MKLTSFDQIPAELTKYAYVEFTMPQTQVSHTTVRSVSISNSPSDDPPEKYVRQLARHEYRLVRTRERFKTVPGSVLISALHIELI